MAYEIGYKGTLADGRGQVNASIYRYDYEGYQDQIDTYDAAQARSVDTVTNAGDAVNQGFEIEVNWLLGDYLTVGGNYSYTDTEYSESYLVTERMTFSAQLPIPIRVEPRRISGNYGNRFRLQQMPISGKSRAIP